MQHHSTSTSSKTKTLPIVRIRSEKQNGEERELLYQIQYDAFVQEMKERPSDINTQRFDWRPVKWTMTAERESRGHKIEVERGLRETKCTLIHGHRNQEKLHLRLVQKTDSYNRYIVAEIETERKEYQRPNGATTNPCSPSPPPPLLSQSTASSLYSTQREIVGTASVTPPNSPRYAFETTVGVDELTHKLGLVGVMGRHNISEGDGLYVLPKFRKTLLASKNGDSNRNNSSGSIKSNGNNTNHNNNQPTSSGSLGLFLMFSSMVLAQHLGAKWMVGENNRNSLTLSRPFGAKLAGISTQVGSAMYEVVYGDVETWLSEAWRRIAGLVEGGKLPFVCEWEGELKEIMNTFFERQQQKSGSQLQQQQPQHQQQQQQQQHTMPQHPLKSML